MDEFNESVSTETESSADDWDDIDLSDAEVEADGDAAETETEAADQPAEEPAEANEEGAGDAEPPAQEEAKETDQSFELKHLDEVRTVGRDEVITLAQKGLDYDRIREKYEASKEVVDFYTENEVSIQYLRDLAAEQGISFDEMVQNTQAQIMSNRTKQPLEVCKGIVANERKAAELDRRAKAMESKAAEETTVSAAKERMQADVRAFAAAYPEIARNPEQNIPKEVWDEVHKGETLVHAYRAYENRQLKAELEKERSAAQQRAQEQKNKARSTGSQKSAGKKSEMDEFDLAWYDGN